MLNIAEIFLAGVLIISLYSCKSNESVVVPTPVNNDMVVVPAGEFTMGCNKAKEPLCQFVKGEDMHTVYLDEYQIDKYEVTFEKYQKCVDKKECTPPGTVGACNYGWKGVDKFPVNCVTWHQAQTFCKWDGGKRLPTEAEWEKAARGTDERIYPWGNEAPSCNNTVMDRKTAKFLGCGTGNTLNVGSKPKGASPYGAMDMAGNLWEWTADWHSFDYYKQSSGKNPTGPISGDFKSCRGGDFFSRHGYEVRTTSRFPYVPEDFSIAVGFRCAKPSK